MSLNVITGGLLAAVLLASPVQAKAEYDLNSLSTGYESQARFEYSQNDVIGFVYEWFAGFDHQREAGFFLNRIATPVDMAYPDFPIRSQDDFLRWYKGVTDNIVWNSHQLNAIQVTGDQRNGWEVTYNVLWDARDISGKQYHLNVTQEMDLIRQGDVFKIVRFRARLAEES